MFIATLMIGMNSKIDYCSQLRKYGYKVIECSEVNELCRYGFNNIDVFITDLEDSSEDWCSIPNVKNKCIQIIEPNYTLNKINSNKNNTTICLTKPVDIKALVAVIEGVNRHAQIKAQEDEVEHRLCSSKRTLCLSDGDEISLSASEGIILYTLAQLAPQPVSRKSLSESLGQDFRFYDERKLEAIVSRLRRKIKPLTPNAEVIKAARGRGYQLMLNVSIT